MESTNIYPQHVYITFKNISLFSINMSERSAFSWWQVQRFWMIR